MNGRRGAESLDPEHRTRGADIAAPTLSGSAESTDTAPQRQGDHGNGPLPVYLDYSLGVIGILAVGSWLLLQGKTELGTIVAFVSGLTRMNGPWGELVNYFRDLTNAGLKYRMIASELDLRAAEPA